MISLISQQKPGTRERSGFTIVELLVAMSITIILAGILLIMTNGVLRTWNRTSGSLSTNNQAQLVFDLVAEDLESIFYRGDGGVWFAVDVLTNSNSIANRGWTIPPSGNYKPDGTISNDRESDNLVDCRYGLGGAWLRFFTNGIDTQPRAVAYQLARRNITGNPTLGTNPAEVRYMLYRSEINPITTLQRGYDLDPTLPPGGPTGYNFIANNHLRAPPSSEVIANNVIDFGIRLYARNAGVLEPIFPYSGNNWDDNETTYEATGTSTAPFPEVVDVMVRILSEEGARLIQNLESGLIPDNNNFNETWWTLAELHSQVFTKRIYVNTRSF